jgi:hypothetical protein
VSRLTVKLGSTIATASQFLGIPSLTALGAQTPPWSKTL